MGLIHSRLMTQYQIDRYGRGNVAFESIGYTIYTSEGKRMGTVADVMFDDEANTIPYLIVDTSTAEFEVNNPRVLLPVPLCCIDQEQRTVRSEAGMTQVQAAPGYDPTVDIVEGYERFLIMAYGERPTWPT